MTARKTDKVQVACPHCGHRQAESRLAISTNCRKCRQYFSLEKKPKAPARQRASVKPKSGAERRITCFDCGTELTVAVNAESTMCKRCSSYVDLKDYRIDGSVSKNFKTKGTFTIETKGYLFNTETTAEHVILKGRVLGKLDARGSLTIHSGAQIKGSFEAGKLIIPSGEHFRWPQAIHARSMDISGELAADITVSEVACLREGSRFFGNVQARNLVVESGAVVVGDVKVGDPHESDPLAQLW
jgi:cytoskeletal protein CcmA (bactofilin family)